MSAVGQLWVELGASMRALRVGAGTSLRQAELASGRGRGSLSQAENAKARPGRELVEWYDSTFAGDGLLLSIYAEARGATGPRDGARAPASLAIPGDRLLVEQPLIAHGELVTPGATLAVGWTLVNDGCIEWRDRRLRRVGAHAAARMIASPRAVPIPYCPPRRSVPVRLPVTVPSLAGTFVAYWVIADSSDRVCFAGTPVLSVSVTAR